MFSGAIRNPCSVYKYGCLCSQCVSYDAVIKQHGWPIDAARAAAMKPPATVPSQQPAMPSVLNAPPCQQFPNGCTCLACAEYEVYCTNNALGPRYSFHSKTWSNGTLQPPLSPPPPAPIRVPITLTPFSHFDFQKEFAKQMSAIDELMGAFRPKPAKLPPMNCRDCNYYNPYAGPEHLIDGVYVCRSCRKGRG